MPNPEQSSETSSQQGWPTVEQIRARRALQESPEDRVKRTRKEFPLASQKTLHQLIGPGSGRRPKWPHSEKRIRY